MKVVIIGSGNVATCLGVALKKNKFKVVQIVSSYPAKKFSLLLKCPTVSSIDNIDRTADFYLIAVSDKRIVSVVEKLKGINGLIAHTSGSVPLSVFKNKLKNYGVIYPVQTLNAAMKGLPAGTPFAIEASSKKNETMLMSIALLLSKNIIKLSSEKRLALHLAAVFANNFTNHLFSLSQKLLAKYKLRFKILLPLIHQTVLNIEKENPALSQTGPAKRNDVITIKKHLLLLKNETEFTAIYKLLTASIKKQYEK